VISFTQLLERRYRGELGTDADEYIRFIVDAGIRMQTLINDLLEFSRVTTRRGEIRPVDIADVVQKTLHILHETIEGTGAAVICGPLPVVRADEAQLVLVFQNLIGNAIKYHGDHPPRVEIAAERKGQTWQFSVTDNGIGIEPQYFERIFVIFQRLHGREKYPGTGIGLAIVKRIVERHGGRIWVESEPGKGSTFHFTFPDAAVMKRWQRAEPSGSGCGGADESGSPPS
jgi:light-regulated signal transduction histidine kinase (bacteriophytochrome)